MSKNSPQDQLLDHTYDGIQEYDNPLPGWWIWTFYITVAFSIPYFVYYQMGEGATVHDNYKADMAELKKIQKKAREAFALASLGKMTKDPAAIKAGKEVFTKYCAVCHGNKGEGKIGPNLTDNYWLHGASSSEIYKIVSKGINQMPGWEKQLKMNELAQVVGYVMSLKGTNPPNAKKPEGKKYP